MQAETTPGQVRSGMPGELLAVLAAAEAGLASAPSPSQVHGSRAQWAEVLAASQRVINVVAAVQDEAIVALAAIEPEVLEDATVVESHRPPGHVALDAPAIVSGALAVAAVHAEHRVRAAVRFAADGPAGTVTETGLGGLHDAMRRGELDAYRAGVIADELELAPPQVAAAVVAALGEHLSVDDGPRLRRRCRTVLSRVSPDLVVQRVKQARDRCGLRRWAEEPGVDKWEGTFPSEDAARAWAAIDARAHQLVADGTCPRIERARSQALIDLVTGSATIETVLTLTVPAPLGDCAPGGDARERLGPGAQGEAAAPADPTVTSGAVDAAPAVVSTQPAAAQVTAATTTSPEDLVEVSMGTRGERVLVTRAFLDGVTTALTTRIVERGCHPDSGALLTDTISDAYRPPASLAALVRQRDGRCRFPGCHVSARFCDLDHVRPWPNGPTTAANLICLCRRHHRVKQRSGWRVRPHCDGTLTWTDPTGRARTTHPVDALTPLVLPAPENGHATTTGTATPPSTDRHSATEFALEHALAALTRADHEHRAALQHVPRARNRRDDPGPGSTTGSTGRLRIDLHHPHDHRPRADQLVLAITRPRPPGHRTSPRRRGPAQGGEGDAPPF